MYKKSFLITTDPALKNRAGIGPRLTALSLDSVFSWMGGGLSGFIFQDFFQQIFQQKLLERGGQDVAQLGSGMVEFYSLLAAIIAGALGFSLLSGLLEAFSGASVGKHVMKLRILSSDRSHPEISKLVLRAVLKHISFLFFLLTLLTGIQLYAILGGLMGTVISIGMFLILSNEKQTLYDRIAETAVYPMMKSDQS